METNIEDINRYANSFNSRQKVEILRYVSQMKHINRIRQARQMREHQLRHLNNYYPSHMKHLLPSYIEQESFLKNNDQCLNPIYQTSAFTFSKRSSKTNHSSIKTPLISNDFSGTENQGFVASLKTVQKNGVEGKTVDENKKDSDFLGNCQPKKHTNRKIYDLETGISVKREHYKSKKLKLNKSCKANYLPLQIKRKQWEKQKYLLDAQGGDNLETKSNPNENSNYRTDCQTPEMLFLENCLKFGGDIYILTDKKCLDYKPVKRKLNSNTKIKMKKNKK